jgi:hypothetical protein
LDDLGKCVSLHESRVLYIQTGDLGVPRYELLRMLK